MAQQRQVPARRWSAATVAVAAAVSLHMVLLSTVIFGGSELTSSRRPTQQGQSASATSAGEEPRMTMILINLPSPKRQSPEEPMASHGLAAADLPIRVVSLDDVQAFDFSDADKSDDSDPDLQPEDPVHHALMVGRYTNQIKARIERAWLRPRSTIGSSNFDCTVQIVQDSQGNVTQMTLQQCNGSADWQASLVRAIQSASPLPAPPEPSAFASAVSMQFSSQAYVTGDAEGFEPSKHVETAVFQWRPPSTSAATSTQRALAPSAAPYASSVKLTIQGDHMLYEAIPETRGAGPRVQMPASPNP